MRMSSASGVMARFRAWRYPWASYRSVKNLSPTIAPPMAKMTAARMRAARALTSHSGCVQAMVAQMRAASRYTTNPADNLASEYMTFYLQRTCGSTYDYYNRDSRAVGEGINTIPAYSPEFCFCVRLGS